MGLLPPNATLLERAVELLSGDRIDGIDAPLRDIWSPRDCPVALLPWLAWALSIDNWDPAWPERVRRARIEVAIAVQRRKGTVSSVREIIAALGGTAALREWWQTTPAGDPHTFAIEVALSSPTGAPSAPFIDSLIAEVNAAKPLRSHFTFTVAQSALARIGLRGAARVATYARLCLAAPADDLPFGTLTLNGEALSLSGENLTLGA